MYVSLKGVDTGLTSLERTQPKAVLGLMLIECGEILSLDTSFTAPFLTDKPCY